MSTSVLWKFTEEQVDTIKKIWEEKKAPTQGYIEGTAKRRFLWTFSYKYTTYEEYENEGVHEYFYKGMIIYRTSHGYPIIKYAYSDTYSSVSSLLVFLSRGDRELIVSKHTHFFLEMTFNKDTKCSWVPLKDRIDAGY